MNIVHITPGAGGMYCGNCFRDNTLVGALRRLGHPTLMVPLYLPLKLDEPDQSNGTPIFFSGLNVYMEQKYPWFRRSPRWMHRLLASPTLLRMAGKRAGKTRPADVSDLTVSMIRGEEGHQARELEVLIAWLKTAAPFDIICLSNILLVGLARRLRAEFHVPVVCSMQGEDSFLDELTEPHREEAWNLIADRVAEVDCLIAPSRYFADAMRARLGLPEDRVRVIPNGISLDGFEPAAQPPDPPVLGYFARMCPQKGLDTLVDAFILLKQRCRVGGLRLRVGGSCGPADEAFVRQLSRRLDAAGLSNAYEFCPNLTRAEKLDFLRSVSVFSVPAQYSEAFGLYLLEAMAAGVPVVQPRHAAFPEIVESTGGGVLCDAGDARSLSDALEQWLVNPAEAHAVGVRGRQAVQEQFSDRAMARAMADLFGEVITRHTQPATLNA